MSALDSYKVDVLRFAAVVRANPGWDFEIYGAAVLTDDGAWRRILDEPNAHHHGPVPFARIAADAEGFELGLVVLAETEYNRSSFPLKTWDYLSLGLPVLAWNAPALAGVDGVHAMNATADLNAYLGTAEARHAWIDEAYRNTADRRWETLVSL